MSLKAAHKTWSDMVAALEASLQASCSMITELDHCTKDGAPSMFDFKEWIDALVDTTVRDDWFLYRVNLFSAGKMITLRVEMEALKAAWVGKIDVNFYNEGDDLVITFKAV